MHFPAPWPDAVGIVSSHPQSPDELRQLLVKKGFSFKEVQGRYRTDLEHAFLVSDIRLDQLIELGERFQQEAVIFGTGDRFLLMFTNGPNRGRSFLANEAKVELGDQDPSGPFVRLNPLWCLVLEFPKLPEPAPNLFEHVPFVE